MAADAPLFLSRPGRYSGWRKPNARWALGLLIVACVLSAWLSFGGSVEPPALDGRMSDLNLYDSIVASMRGGQGYYEAAAQALRSNDYPLRPFLAFRLPTLSLIELWLPGPFLTLLLSILILGIALAWHARLREIFDRPIPLIAGLILLAGGMFAAFEPSLLGFHEIWAGLLIALSLALWSPGRWVDAVAVALAAMLIRETAAAYVVLMAAMALIDGNRREALGWMIALALFGAILGLHAWAVAQVTGPLDPVSQGWLGMNGPGFAINALVNAAPLRLFPDWVAAPVLLLAIFGWTGWKHPLATRIFLMLIGYGLLLAVFARPDNIYWALIAAPLSILGLIFVPDALRDLIRAALDRRAVTVTKISR